MHRRFPSLALAAALLALPVRAGAQTRGAIVVPADAAVVVPPRGAPQAMPRIAASRPAGQRPRLPPMEPAREEGGGLGLSAAGTVAGVLLPAIAAAALTAVLSDGGGTGQRGASGPARTR
ncbi:hypothetical protein GCM10009416_38760 [Craurococcus roseus]|uniref:Uncharacterized protein n=1 Tax=Craurococcus roseus TaxID=77585 RepID=A0ABN1FS86_9PROT